MAESNEALWYVAHTYSGYENKVKQDLQTLVDNRHLNDLICEIRVPTEEVREIKIVRKRSKGQVIEEEKEVIVENKIYPGYVFVKMVMTDDTWYIVRNTRGCTGFVGAASKPEPLSPEEVERMGVEVHTAVQVDFVVGETVQITAGALEGFTGVVETIDTETNKVHLVVNMFGRETPAEVEISHVAVL